ncbi:MAG: PEGA domain-containing protein [Patescibacteria group bacterium]|nr:PEGA domain-containing protein [Patescibacteria group bacterium]MDD5294308.1 PEGA domain-containing protein [Patescibacteria group bacterium]MDD5554131.1 PEGA domain-containing protein [Patescibacteria group bacterium]
MTLKIRRILFFLFVIIFFIVTPWLSFYAAGYKIKLSWPPDFRQPLQKTGMFIFDTSPRGAKIFIDNKPSQLFLQKYFNKERSYIKTPAKIKNILPGEYDIRLELPGYWPWEKKLKVEPGQATYAEDVYLFKKDLPLQITSFIPEEKNFSRLPIRKIEPSFDKRYFFVLNEEKINIIEAGGNDVFSLPLSSIKTRFEPGSPAIWSPDSTKIIAGRVALDLKNGNKITYLDNFLGGQADNFKWGIDSNLLYYQSGSSIGYLDLAAGSKKILGSGENYYDYLVKNDNIFFISGTGKTLKLKGISLKNGEPIKDISLPFSSAYRLINPGHNLINLYDNIHQLLYLIDPFAAINPLREVVNNIKYSEWLDNNRLLYANDFEIWIFDMDTSGSVLGTAGKKILVRISEPITNVLWHPSKNYIIYSTDKTINTIELDERGKRNTTELIKVDQIYSLSLDQKGNTLYFGAKIGNQEGLYKLEIQ